MAWWKGGTRLSSPRRGQLWQCKVPCECPRARRRGAACSEDLAGRTAAAQSCGDTAKPSGWQDARKPGWMLSAQTLLPSALPYEHLQTDGAEGRWADNAAVSTLSLHAQSHVFCIFLGKKLRFNSPKLSCLISSVLQGVDTEEMGQGKQLSSFV